MPELIRGSEGHGFQLGPNLYLYAGPGNRGSKLPVLAVKGPNDKKDVILADFRNSTSAARFITDLQATIEAAQELRVQAALPPLTAEQQATVERFGFDTPPSPEELIERIQLFGQGKVTFVTDDEPSTPAPTIQDTPR